MSTESTYPSSEELAWLRAIGTDLTEQARQGTLGRAVGLEEPCAEVFRAITGARRRSVVILGESGCGKTALVEELAHRLVTAPRGPWLLLRISAANLMAGTKWSGELETKVMELVQAVRAPRRVVVYVPNLDELSQAGVTIQSEMSVATALAPYIADGSIVIVGESTPAVFQKGLGGVESLRRLFQVVEVPASDEAATLRVLERHKADAGVLCDRDLLERLVELSDHYLAGVRQPGRAVGLFRAVADGQRRDEPLSLRSVLVTLSTSTGIPVDLLDDGVPLDLAAVREFFQSRVMGQPEAVRAVADLVTLIKAGLTDPQKPLAVFLFVGPTGVGKTELARSLAEYIFGDPARLLRFDMSEFASYDAYERLIGRDAQPGLLTSAVRDKPFSVVLLDEIEKAHLNVFDLCLQLFDAGRLTDGRGRVVDFRRSIIILTSNVGASDRALSEPIGFVPGATDEAPSTRLQDLGEFFRPEFLNRLDRVISFRPLSPVIAEKIARRELGRVLQRGGIRRRGLTVDIDPGVISVLVRQGYSPMFGARPLKRAVERLVLTQLAKTIATGRLGERSILRLVARGDADVRVEARTPEAGDERGAQLLLAGKSGVDEDLDRLGARLAALEERAGPLFERKSMLLDESSAADFWSEPDRARTVLDEVHRLEGVLGALQGLVAAGRGAEERWRGREFDASRREEIAERLAGWLTEAEQLDHLVGCRDARDLGDAIVAMARVTQQGGSIGAVEKLARMYEGLARFRRLEVTVVDDRRSDSLEADSIVLLVEGGGAFAQLSGESGLHQFVRRSGDGGGGPLQDDRELARVEILPLAGIPELRRRDVRIDVSPLRGVRGRFEGRLDFAIELFHEPTLTAVRAWTRGPRDEAIDRSLTYLAARLAAGTAAPFEDGAPILRRYTFGSDPKVRDLRSGRSTRQIDRVLQGHLGAFLAPRPDVGESEGRGPKA